MYSLTHLWLDTDMLRKRVFLLGPSHHYYLSNCALSKCNAYSTPLGDLPLDLATISELRNSGKFADMALDDDEAEHSLEMHLPYIYKMLSKYITLPIQ
jgi:MEMO1 family protein